MPFYSPCCPLMLVGGGDLVFSDAWSFAKAIAFPSCLACKSCDGEEGEVGLEFMTYDRIF